MILNPPLQFAGGRVGCFHYFQKFVKNVPRKQPVPDPSRPGLGFFARASRERVDGRPPTCYTA